jgi:hypothetical protein
MCRSLNAVGALGVRAIAIAGFIDALVSGIADQEAAEVTFGIVFASQYKPSEMPYSGPVLGA